METKRILDKSRIKALAEDLLDSPCHFMLGTEADPKCHIGAENLVYPLESDSGRRICVRIPKRGHAFISHVVRREIEIRRSIEAAGIDLFEPILASNPRDSRERAPYIALGWADGDPMNWTDSKPASEDERRKIIRAVANASLDLLQIQEPGNTASEWITSKIDRRIARAQDSGDFYSGTIAGCQRQKELLPEYWIPELDRAPHVLVHGDLSASNIIVDENHNVTGIIDLGWAEMVPLQFAAVYPRFLTHEPSRSHELDWTARDTEQMEQDRAFYLECIKTRAEREGGILLDYLRVLSRQDEISRYWWRTAAGRADIHKAMISCDWAPPIKGAKSAS